MCMYGWAPCYSPETITSLLISYTPIKKIESLKKITYFTSGTCYFLEQSLRIYIKHAININVLIFISLARKLLYDLAIPLPGIYSEKTIIQKSYVSLCSLQRYLQDMEAISMSIDRWMDKDVVYIVYNWILFSHYKERNWVICNDVVGPRVCHREWSKLEREKQIPYIKAYVWNLGKKNGTWTYFQGRKRDAHRELMCGHREGMDWIWKVALASIHYHIK